METMMGDIAEFARPKGAKDKQPRKRRTGRNIAIAAGLAGVGVAGVVGARKLASARRAVSAVTKNNVAKTVASEVPPPVGNTTPRASGYKGLSRAEKSKKVRQRQKAIQRQADLDDRNLYGPGPVEETGYYKDGMKAYKEGRTTRKPSRLRKNSTRFDQKPSLPSNENSSKLRDMGFRFNPLRKGGEEALDARTYAARARKRYGAKYSTSAGLTKFVAATRGGRRWSKP